ncbi:MAG: hypothetical protein M3Y51_09780 [Actinomycetota bacterium]|nr:hypothetical protein [Actinomycetota bacterium]
MRRHTRTWTVAGLAVALLAAGSLAGCSSSDGDSEGPDGEATIAADVHGWAYAGAPLEDATVSISTMDGEPILESGQQTTTENGTFSETADVPEAYRVTVDGGTVGDAVFTGALVADVSDLGAHAGPIQVNPVTTLLAAYRDANPKATRDQAQAAVAAFLQLPTGIDVSADLRGLDQMFSPAEFATQAQAAGGMQPFVDQLIEEMAASPMTPHPFVAPSENGFFTDQMKKAAMALAKLGMQKALEQMGLETPDHAITDSLNQIAAQVTALQASVNEVKQLVSQDIYNNAITPALAIQNKVINAYGNLRFAADHDDASKHKLAMQQIDSLAEDAALTRLNGILMGELGRTGAYRALSDSLKAKGPFWNPADSQQLIALVDYFNAVQAQLIMLLAEKAYADGTEANFELPGNDLAQYMDQMAAQAAVTPSAAAPAPIDMRTNLMWAVPRDVPDTGYSWYQQHGVSLLNGCVVVNGYPLDICGANNPIGKPLLGFDNWTAPDIATVSAMVAGQAQPSAWLARPENWGPNALKRTAPNPAITTIWSTSRAATPDLDHYLVLNLANGKQVTVLYDAGATWIPIRQVSALERYWM